MTKNLELDRFRKGDIIPEVKGNKEWAEAGNNRQPAWCYYENKPGNGNIYGKLYNWFAVNDPRGLAPEGWHIPTNKEWSTLTDSLGGEESIRRKNEKYRNSIPEKSGHKCNKRKWIFRSSGRCSQPKWRIQRRWIRLLLVEFLRVQYNICDGCWLYHDECRVIISGSTREGGLSVRCLMD
ncbi:MAG: fibrobacter succinogenes major paralogous domain-containing protein [Bacteroidota bacterium]|nr:fibrobacter succinogenes major paralogous domain-containing protein [Bacteroidota bacterium]